MILIFTTKFGHTYLSVKTSGLKEYDGGQNMSEIYLLEYQNHCWFKLFIDILIEMMCKF